MIRYEKLPKKTSQGTVAGILACGLFISFGIVTTGAVAAYCLVGAFASVLYPVTSLVSSNAEAAYLLLILLAAAITITMLGFLAFWMDKLSKNALPLSRVMWVPTVLVAFLVQWQHTSTTFTYHISSNIVVACWISTVVAGIFPMLFLATAGARKLHNR